MNEYHDIASELRRQAAQENCDGEPYDVMQAASDYIRELEAENERLQQEARGQGVPEGWQLVPVEPTWDMTRPGFRAGVAVRCDECDAVYKVGLSHDKTVKLYKAILAAAPQPQEDTNER